MRSCSLQRLSVVSMELVRVLIYSWSWQHVIRAKTSSHLGSPARIVWSGASHITLHASDTHCWITGKVVNLLWGLVSNKMSAPMNSSKSIFPAGFSSLSQSLKQGFYVESGNGRFHLKFRLLNSCRLLFLWMWVLFFLLIHDFISGSTFV